MRLPKTLLQHSALSSLLLLLTPTTAFYIPGVAPTSYEEGDLVPLYVNRLTPTDSSMNSELNTDSVLSRGYYHPGFHFCRPKDGPRDVGSESLGSILFGDRIKTSPFELKMMKNESCKLLCEAKFDGKSAMFTTKRILENLQYNWLVDGLPVGQPYTIDGGPDIYYTLGFPLGAVEPDTGRPVLHNHFDIVIDYHAIGAGQYRVVGVQAAPSSRQNSRKISETDADCGDREQPLQLNPEGQTNVAWTYSVEWRPSKTAWSTRWDIYLHLQNPAIHWLSIVSTAVLVLVLVATVSALLMRALKRDFARYNKLDAFSLEDFSTSAAIEDGVQEDSGWKLVHGDVFRPPKNPLLLSLLLGNGAQLFFMTGVTIAFALLGFLSPSNRGALGTAMIMLYTIFGFIGGYVSARVYKTFGGEAWKRNIVLTPVLVPATVFGTFFLLDLFLWVQESSGAVPFTTMLVLVAIWFLISVPLSFAGSWIGFKQAAFETPVKTNQIPRQIPPSTHWLRPIPSMFIVGLVPFCAIFVELNSIMNSVWSSKVYYMFGFLFLCYGIMIITCASVTIMFVYHLLCQENYRWQWRAFNCSGACAIFIFVARILYWLIYLRFTGFTSLVLYVGYTGLISFLCFVLAGTIGFFASWAFIQKIYASIRID